MPTRRTVLSSFLGALVMPAVALGRPATQRVTLRGRVLPLRDVAKLFDLDVEADALPHWLVLATDDGRYLAIVKDTGGRTFYRDPRLQQRPVQVEGYCLPGGGIVQIVRVLTVKGNQLYEVYYWCDVCAIKRYFLEKVCECCGGPMELREVPVKD
ncbi:MAG: hypothetical protein C4297_00960 [Gemmataceae bacterium]